MVDDKNIFQKKNHAFISLNFLLAVAVYALHVVIFFSTFVLFESEMKGQKKGITNKQRKNLFHVSLKRRRYKIVSFPQLVLSLLNMTWCGEFIKKKYI